MEGGRAPSSLRGWQGLGWGGGGFQAVFHLKHNLSLQIHSVCVPQFWQPPQRAPCSASPWLQVRAHCLPPPQPHIPPQRWKSCCQALPRHVLLLPCPPPLCRPFHFLRQKHKMETAGKENILPKMAEGGEGFARWCMSTLWRWMGWLGGGGNSSPALLQPHRLQAERETPTSPYWVI